MMLQSSQHAFMLMSSNDPNVPAPLSIQLAHRINAQIFEVKQAGHFEKIDGYADFPQVLEIIQQLYGQHDLQNVAGL